MNGVRRANARPMQRAERARTALLARLVSTLNRVARDHVPLGSRTNAKSPEIAVSRRLDRLARWEGWYGLTQQGASWGQKTASPKLAQSGGFRIPLASPDARCQAQGTASTARRAALARWRGAWIPIC